jgi:hypothetical protein
MEGDLSERAPKLEDYRHEVARLNESTIVEKSEMEWPRQVRPHHVINAIKLWFSENYAILTRRQRFRPIEPVVRPTDAPPTRSGA